MSRRWTADPSCCCGATRHVTRMLYALVAVSVTLMLGVTRPGPLWAEDRAADGPLTDQTTAAQSTTDTLPAVSQQPPSEDLSAVRDALGWIPLDRWGSSAGIVLSMAVLGFVPALLLMTTCYLRITIVLGLLRQAFGSPQVLPAQAVTAITLFCTALVMWPTWQRAYDAATAVEAVDSEDAVQVVWRQAAASVVPIRQFMSRQIDATGNADHVWLFLRFAPDSSPVPNSYDEVPLRVLLPAYVLSELKTAFLMGFQIYLPFLVIDLLVSAVTTSMGMFMLPPSMIALPLKLLLFVLVDGWYLLVGMLLESFY